MPQKKKIRQMSLPGRTPLRGGSLACFRGCCYTVAARATAAPAILPVKGSSMSGHSKWATIKHKKAATDARRGKVFTKIIRELTIAARTGGADPDTNPRLRTAILTAKGENMPNDNIERAIQRGTGNLEGETLDEVTFEGYGPGGVGLLVQVVTSNRNRIVSEIRHMLSKNGGNMAETGAVGWMFERKGDIVVPKEAADEDKMMGIVLDAGAEDLRDDGAAWEVTTPPEAMEKVREALTAAGIKPSSAEVGFVPKNYVKLTGAQAQQMVRMMEALEDHDDVQHVYANFDIDENEIQAAVAS
jgi:YebC/PmpR family DNA-binding regulatory protein